MEKDRAVERVRKMTIDDKVTAEEIVMNAGMNPKPGFYSGRGATIIDLDSRLLERIYEGILRAHGQEAAGQYVQMVASIPKLSATDFLLTLYSLEGNHWKWDPNLVNGAHGLYPDGEVIAAVTVLSVLGGMDRVDETPTIREAFLIRHGEQIPIDCYDDGMNRRRFLPRW